jgi:TATA-binding protein-associated factor Taf7
MPIENDFEKKMVRNKIEKNKHKKIYIKIKYKRHNILHNNELF